MGEDDLKKALNKILADAGAENGELSDSILFGFKIFAKMVRGYFEALLQGGFSATEALHLTAGFQTDMLHKFLRGGDK
jgi:hypothetical protein